MSEFKSGRAIAGAVATAILLAAHNVPGLADPLGSDNLTGFDGILTRCVISTDRKYTLAMCDRLVEAAKKQAGDNKLAITHAGSVDWDSGMVSPTAPADAGFDNPLWLTFYIRGTGGKVPGALARASFHVPFAAAVEKAGGDATPRQGQLVIWEDATIGSGPSGQLGPAVADAVAKKMKPVFAALGAAGSN